MKTYLDQLDTNKYSLEVCLSITGIANNGIPLATVIINNTTCFSSLLSSSVLIRHKIPLLEPVSIKILMFNKQYSELHETGIAIELLQIDQINLAPNYSQQISYVNDQQQPIQAFYLGYNGIWRFNIDEPFYRWWHRVSGQGWLLEPAPI